MSPGFLAHGTGKFCLDLCQIRLTCDQLLDGLYCPFQTFTHSAQGLVELSRVHKMMPGCVSIKIIPLKIIFL